MGKFPKKLIKQFRGQVPTKFPVANTGGRGRFALSRMGQQQKAETKEKRIMAKTVKDIQKAWETVKAELEVFDTPVNAKGDTYTRYVWDNECEALKQFWKDFDIKSRKALGLTAHKVGDDLLIYELGFDISKKKATPKKAKSVALKGGTPRGEWADKRVAKKSKAVKEANVAKDLTKQDIADILALVMEKVFQDLGLAE